MDQQIELAKLLLRKATDDLEMAHLLAREAGSPEWGLGFHVQQAVEKALKSVLCSRAREYPRTHSISLLLDLLSESSLDTPFAREQLILLTPFGVLFRYDELGPTDQELENLPDRASILGLAESVVNWASEMIENS